MVEAIFDFVMATDFPIVTFLMEVGTSLVYQVMQITAYTDGPVHISNSLSLLHDGEPLEALKEYISSTTFQCLTEIILC